MLEQLSIITYGLGNTAIANEIFIIDKLGGVIEQISKIEFRDNGAIRDPSGTRVRNPVVSRTFRDGWQLWDYHITQVQG